MAEGRTRGRDRLDAPWARGALARVLRELILVGGLGPAMDAYTRRQVSGRPRLAELDAPVIFVANHSSHMDTPAILRAMPGRWRRRTAVAAAADYFYRKRKVANAVSLLFNTVPMQRQGGGLEPDSTAHLADLLTDRWSLLVFAEGTRSRDGTVGRLRSGAAVLAAEHGLPIVPIYLSGTRNAMPPGRRWMHRKPGRFLSRRHLVQMRFGPAIRPRPDEDPTEVMERVRLFFAESGATTTATEDVAAGEERRTAGQPV
jgi:1-acyl-sn-glycerol-3-phosphate acyltransferase